MAKIETKNKQNPKLVQTTLKDGRASLALEYYLGRSESPVLDDEGNQVFYTSGAMSGKPKYKVKHNRKRENLNLYIWIHPRSPQERTQNRNTLALAEKIRFEREQEFLEDREGYRLKKEKEVDLLRYFRKHREDEVYARSTRIGFGTAYRRFIDFLGSMPKYKKYVDFLRMDLLTPEMVGGYVEYLKKVSVGDGGARTYGLFKKVITTAVEEGLMKKNPCKGIAMRKDAYAIKKQILTLDEIRRLASTPFAGSYPDIRRAFLFSLYTGIRWRDVSQLTYENVDLSSGLLKFEQSKIAGRSKSSSVVTPLSPMLHKIIGEPEVHGDCRQLIFCVAYTDTDFHGTERGHFGKSSAHCLNFHSTDNSDLLYFLYRLSCLQTAETASRYCGPCWYDRSL